MRALGIDFGERRIGLAISDTAGRLAVPLTTVERQTDRRAAYRIADLARAEQVETIVVGEPLLPDGTPGPMVARVHGFARRLQRATGLPVRLHCETLTSIAADERLAEGTSGTGGAKKDAKKDGRRDAMAAQILLQDALDSGKLEENSAREAGSPAHQVGKPK